MLFTASLIGRGSREECGGKGKEKGEKREEGIPKIKVGQRRGGEGKW